MSAREGFSEALRMKFNAERQYESASLFYFVHMNDTAVFFRATPKPTVHTVVVNTVSIHCTPSNSRRIKDCVSVACDGSKPPPFVIFKSKPNEKIEESLRHNLPQSMYGCCKIKDRMSERSMKICSSIL